MNKLTTGVCCFALSAVFAWVSASLASSAAAARAQATTVGAYLMMQHPSSDNGIAIVATTASVLMLVVGWCQLRVYAAPGRSHPRRARPRFLRPSGCVGDSVYLIIDLAPDGTRAPGRLLGCSDCCVISRRDMGGGGRIAPPGGDKSRWLMRRTFFLTKGDDSAQVAARCPPR
jgi:hypothetical protein